MSLKRDLAVKQKVIDAIRQAAEDSNGEVEFLASYSGRGMFGDKCVGLTGSMGDIMHLIAEVIVAAGDEMHDAAFDCDSDDKESLEAVGDAQGLFVQTVYSLLKFDTDTMGRGEVVYFRGLITSSAHYADN